MLMAYDDCGFTIKDIPTDDTRVGSNPIEDLTKAKEILAWAKKERHTVHWILQGNGPFRVRESK
jgi:hypothetical protein